MSDSSLQHHVKVQAFRPEQNGTTSIVDGWPVLFVSTGPFAIRYCQYSANYTRVSDRPWRVGKNSYKTLPNALRALSKPAQV